MFKRIITVISLVCINVHAQDFSQKNVNINVLGSHVGQTFYLSLKEGFKTDCAWGGLYCSVSNENCKSYLSILLSAKMAEKALAEIRYQQDSGTKKCSVSLVAIQ